MLRNRIVSVALAAVVVTPLAPAAAEAAGKPVVTTGAPADVGQQTATLTGSVAPNGAPTTYSFQYGPTKLYGAATAAASTTTKVHVTAPVGGLAPATTYHYRLVAQNSHGTVMGTDHVLKTQRQPLGVTLVATPNPLLYGGGTTLAGTLTGTGNANRAVVLQGNPFPYTQGFANVGNSQLTDAQGNFAFPLLSVPLNTQYRVLMTDRPAVVSPIVTVGVAVRLSTHVRRHRLSRGARLRFTGIMRPARDGAPLAVQKFSRGAWRTIGTGITRHGGDGYSRYTKRVRIRHSGTFRVLIAVNDGNYVPNVGRSVHIRLHPR